MLRRFVVPLALWLAFRSHVAPGALGPEEARARLQQHRWVFDAQNPNGDTKTVQGFVAAAGQGLLDDVALYLAAGIDVNVQDRTAGSTTALIKAIARIQPKTARYLLEHGADPNLANGDAVSPLQIAIRASLFKGWREGYRELVDALIARGARIESRDSAGTTPLMEAAVSGNGDVVALLLTKGASLDAKREDGRTALLLASGKAPRLAAALVDLGADVNAADRAGRTPLMEAVRDGWLEVVKPALMDYFPEYIRMLLDRGANVNAADRQGVTALADAAANGDLETVRLLLSKGARPTQVAFDAAVQNLRGKVVQALVAAGYTLTPKQRLEYRLGRFALLLARLFPFLILAAIPALVLASRRELKKPRPPKHDAAHGEKLPRLAPLTCTSCGGGVPLAPGRMKCPHCGTPARAPESYERTLAMRAQAAEALQRAVEEWRHASLFTAAPVRIFFWSVGFVWLAVTYVGIFNEIGRSLFAGHGLLIVFAVLGGVGLPFFSMSYATYLGDVRKRLPVIPEIGKQVGEAEVAGCATCGAAIAYAAGQVVTSCGYCGTETYRVELARRSRLLAREEKAKASLSLYEAMVEVAERRRELFENLLMTPLYLPVLLTMAPIGTLLVLALLALLNGW